MPSVIIREMKETDLDEVSDIEMQCFTRPWTRENFRDSINRDDTIFVVAADDTEVAGYVGMYVAFGEGEITNVAVSPMRRREHIGSALIAGVNTIAETENMSSIILEVRASNTAAIALYSKFGYENIGVRKNFYDFPREDAIIMKRNFGC